MDWFQLSQGYRATTGISLLFTNKFPGIPGTYLINLRRMKDRVDLEFPGANTQKNAINSLKFRGSVLWNH